MYGPYLAALMKTNPTKDDSEEKPKLKWYTCRPCLVQWTEITLTSHCFVCGKWGTRGQYFK